jgi:CheY-like chemotaxis protein
MKVFQPDVVVCDWHMDGADSITFAEEVRGGIPIVMMTSRGDATFQDRARAAGVARLLEKPISARSFLEAVSQTVTVAGQ